LIYIRPHSSSLDLRSLDVPQILLLTRSRPAVWYQANFTLVIDSAVRIFKIPNGIVPSAFDLNRAQLFKIDKGFQENDVSVKMCMCAELLLTKVQVLYLYIDPLWLTKY